MSKNKHQDERYKNYLLDLGFEIRRLALEAKADMASAPDASSREFETGRLMALNEVVSVMQQQATGFGIPLTDLRLADIEPDRDLV
ncbi:MAG TPA: hypothetical protein VFF17_00580 [Thermoanaerobaculia bacterium]|nr:hypothetical protein [Thermoanaerobaculia bacterium]